MNSHDVERSDRGSSQESEAEDSELEAPIGDDLELAWLQARSLEPNLPEPVPGLARQYARLEQLLSELPPVPGEAEWHAGVLRAARAQQRRTRRIRWALGGGGLVAAAAAAVLVVRSVQRPEPPAPSDGEALTLKVSNEGRARSGRPRGSALKAGVGSRLIASAWSTEPGRELRVYRGQALVARCPGGPHCATWGGLFGAQAIEVDLDAPGMYYVLDVPGGSRSAALPLEPMDAYLEALGAEVVPRDRTIKVE